MAGQSYGGLNFSSTVSTSAGVDALWRVRRGNPGRAGGLSCTK